MKVYCQNCQNKRIKFLRTCVEPYKCIATKRMLVNETFYRPEHYIKMTVLCIVENENNDCGLYIPNKKLIKSNKGN